jgi:carbonic anhydrase/acetyltransferase-like protein (isoleucine patch superfamily)
MNISYNHTHPDIDDTARVFPGVIIVGDVTIHSQVNIWFNAVVRGDMASIEIGENTNIQDQVVIHTNIDAPVRIGKNVTIGHSAIIHAATILDDALIGMGAIILDKAVVESGAMVAAGTVVPPGKKVPSGMLAMGNPMRIVRELTQAEKDQNAANIAYYLNLANSYISQPESA